jgi:glycosyltransferase involved in cell wall biosynthesis
MKRPIKKALCRLFDAAIAYTEHARAYAIRTLRFDETRVWVGTATVDTEGLQAFGRAFTERGRAEWRRKVFGDDAAGRIVLLYAGRLVESKGVDTLLCAFARLPQPFALVLAGMGEWKTFLQNLARQLGIESRTRWLGFLDWEELAAAYHSSDILVLPSRSEPHGNVVNEAAACGLPVVVSNGVGTDVLAHGVTGLRFRAEDDRELEAALRSLADTDVRRRMGAAGAARVAECFTLQHQVDAYRMAIETTLRRHSPGSMR